MTNRQDRRYAAKLARQAARRGRTPAERALFNAAAAYSADRPSDLDFSLDGFDAAWVRLEPELRELLDAGYDEFRRDIFAEAAWGHMVGTSPAGEERAFDLEPILFPVTGAWADLRAFAGDAARLEGLAASLLASGVFPEDAAIAILPVVLAADAVDLMTVGPAAAGRLTFGLADLFQGRATAGGDAFAAAVAAVRDANLPVIEEAGDTERLTGLLLGICLAPAEDADMSDDEAEARRLAMAASRASWLDTYAGDLPFRLDEPVFWHEAGASLAWHGVLGAIEAELARRGPDERVARIDACLFPDEGDPVLVAHGAGAPFGPFHAPRRLVETDIDGFADLAEHIAGELVEHESPKEVLRLLEGAAPTA